MDRISDGPIFSTLFWWQKKEYGGNNDGNDGHTLKTLHVNRP